MFYSILVECTLSTYKSLIIPEINLGCIQSSQISNHFLNLSAGVDCCNDDSHACQLTSESVVLPCYFSAFCWDLCKATTLWRHDQTSLT